MSRVFEILRRHCFLLATVLILWRGWSATQAAELPPPEADEAAAVEPPDLRPEDFPERSADESLHAPFDPFFIEALLLQEREREAARQAAMAGPVRSAAPSQEEILGVRHAITLQSTVSAGPAPRAWINGQDLALGDPLAGVDDAAPPVLVGVSGTAATLEYRGELLRLDLDAAAVAIVFVLLSGPPPARPQEGP
jgi:hypothetical protein